MAVCGNCRSSRLCTCYLESTCVENVYLGELISLPGVTGNYISTPDSADLSVAGDIDIRVKLAAVSYTPASDQTLVSKWNTSGNQRSFVFRIVSTGELEFEVSNDGSTVHTGTSTVATGFAANSTHWVRINFTADAGAADKDFRFYTSADGLNWLQLGSIVTTATAVAVFDSTADVEIGSHSGGNSEMFEGLIYHTELRAGPNAGTTLEVRFEGDRIGVFEPKRAIVLAAQSPTTVDAVTGETWTINGTGWSWLSQSGNVCATLTGNGSTYTPYNFRPNNVPLPRPYGMVSRRGSGTQTITANTVEKIVFTTDDTPFDGGMIDLVGTPTGLTVQQEGYYLVYAQVTFNGNDALFSLIKTPHPAVTTDYEEIAQFDGFTTYGTYSAVSLYPLAAGDVIEVRVRNLAGASVDILSTSGAIPDPFPVNVATYPYLWAQWVRPL